MRRITLPLFDPEREISTAAGAGDDQVGSVLRTVTIYYSFGFGFGSDFSQVTVPAPVPAPYLDHKNLAFLMLIEAALLPRNLSSHLLGFHFITVPVPLRQEVTVFKFPYRLRYG